MYEIIKKQHGEHFAQTLRAYHNGIFDIPELDKILQFAGNNADDVKFFLYSLLRFNQQINACDENPFDLLEKAGYTAYYADTLAKQNAIAKYFAKGEELCTFNDKNRYQNYHIINAVKQNANTLCREDFVYPEREDAYATSVLSIQILKTGGFISIKNRYNHAVANSDNTFNSNPDNIIAGLGAALKKYFKVDFSPARLRLPQNYIFLHNQIFKYSLRINHFYCGTNFYIHNNTPYKINKNTQIVCAPFIIDLKNKKVLDPAQTDDSFPVVLEAELQNKKLKLTKDTQGNHYLYANGIQMLKINANGQIKELHLEDTQTIGDNFGAALSLTNMLEKLSAPNLTQVGNNFFTYGESIKSLYLPELKTTQHHFLTYNTLPVIGLPKLESVGNDFMAHSDCLEQAFFDSLQTVQDNFLEVNRLSEIALPRLETAGNFFMEKSLLLEQGLFHNLQSAGDDFLRHQRIKEVSFPSLKTVGDGFMYKSPLLEKASFDKLKTTGDDFLYHNSLTRIASAALETVGDNFMRESFYLKHAVFDKLHSAGAYFLDISGQTEKLIAPRLSALGYHPHPLAAEVIAQNNQNRTNRSVRLTSSPIKAVLSPRISAERS